MSTNNTSNGIAFSIKHIIRGDIRRVHRILLLNLLIVIQRCWLWTWVWFLVVTLSWVFKLFCSYCYHNDHLMNFHHSQVVLEITQVSARIASSHYAPLGHGLKEYSVSPEHRFTCSFFRRRARLGRRGFRPVEELKREKMFDLWLTNGDCSSVTWSSSRPRQPPCNWRTHLPTRQGGEVSLEMVSLGT